MEYLQATIRGNRVLVQDESYVQACNCCDCYDVFQAMDRHKCNPVLRANDFQISGPLLKYHVPARNWCCRGGHFHCNHSIGSPHRQNRSQANSHNWCNRDGNMPHYHSSNCGNRHPLMAEPQSSRMGCSGNGLALRRPLRLLLGPLRLDHRGRDLATVKPTVWNCARCKFKFDVSVWDEPISYPVFYHDFETSSISETSCIDIELIADISP